MKTWIVLVFCLGTIVAAGQRGGGGASDAAQMADPDFDASVARSTFVEMAQRALRRGALTAQVSGRWRSGMTFPAATIVSWR
jgi:hypothetical protein